MQLPTYQLWKSYLTFPELLDFVNVPPTHSLDSLHKMVAENGGTFSMNLNNSVSHCIAAESRGFRFHPF